MIGHVATRWALDHFAGGQSFEELVHAPFAWREGRLYAYPDAR